jgi:Lon protease-like protein
VVLENLEQLEQLPVFPLATVLFPGALLPLHIFEERYKEMMRYAIDNGGVFGLSYRSDAAIGRETPPGIGSVGCVAKIQAVARLDEGKMNVISTGIVRYTVSQLVQSAPFVIARIEPLTDDLEPGEDLNQIYEEIGETCRRFLEAARALDEPNAPVSPEFPEDPESFSLLVASALTIDNDARQTLLEMTSTRLRFIRLRKYVISALAELEGRLKILQRARGNGRGRPSSELKISD